jgi:dihydrofolate synthase/folylpolyglutamate synthase
VSLSYQEAIDFLENLYRQPALPSSQAGLGRVQSLLAAVGDPHREFRSIHVAGSCGKGSTTTMIGAVLMEAGIDCGLFRSPHLESYTERISIGKRDISPEDWARHFNRLLPHISAMQNGEVPGYDLGRPTLFEIVFALACLYFAERGTEWVVAETGLGGRLDATNLLQPHVAVITNIYLEHTQILGNTLAAIAGEKAAIIKSGSSAVTGASGEALAVIESRARSVGAPLLRIGREIRVDRAGDLDGPVRLSCGDAALEVIPGMRGSFQSQNAALALGASLALRESGLSIALETIKRGLEAASLPGRLEFIPDSPPVILDGAHNAAGAEALAGALRRVNCRPGAVLFAAMDDKDVESMARAVAQDTDRVVVTTVPDTPRSASVSRLQRAFEGQGCEVEADPDPASALYRARVMAGGGPLVVTGSLYLVGFVRSHLQGAPVP